MGSNEEEVEERRKSGWTRFHALFDLCEADGFDPANPEHMAVLERARKWDADLAKSCKSVTKEADRAWDAVREAGDREKEVREAVVDAVAHLTGRETEAAIVRLKQTLGLERDRWRDVDHSCPDCRCWIRDPSTEDDE